MDTARGPVRANASEVAESAEGRRMLIAQAFTEIAETQRMLNAAELPFVNYLLDVVKLEMAERAVALIGGAGPSGDREAEMVRWFRNKVAAETAPPESPPEAS